MKRFVAVCMAAVLMIVLLVPFAASAAVEMPILSLEQLSVQAGESIQMKLSLRGNPGIVAMRLSVRYDTAALELTDVKNGSIFPDSTVTFGKDLTDSPYTMLWLDALSTQDYTADGTLATLTFHALPTAKAGKTDIELSYDADNVFDSDLQAVAAFAVQSGSVNITRPIVPVSGVSLPSSLALTVGETRRLTPTIMPANASNTAVTWSVSNAAVTVDENGNVMARSVGTAVITATTNNGKTASCTVTVQPVSVTAVSVPTTFSMTLGEKKRLTATITPTNATNPAVTWRSSNAAVASVDASGNVSALQVGTAVITATTTDGGKTAACTVTVRPATVSVTSVSVPSSLTMNYKDSARLTASVEPANATNPAVTWTSSDRKVVDVDANGNLTTHKKGTATITVTTADGSKTASCRVTVQYTFIQKIIIYLLFGWIWYVK